MDSRALVLLLAPLAACFPPGDPARRAGGGVGGSGPINFFGGGAGGASGGGSAVGGGSGGGAGPAEPVSGTRLKVRVLRAADGQEVFAGWRDTLLNTDCWFWPASDGERRCVPSGVTYAVEGYFSDAQCTAPAWSGQTCTPPTMFYRYDQATCPMRWTYFEVGAALSQRQVYSKSGTSCSQVALSAEESAWAIGPAIPANRFVRGTVTEPAGSTGVGLRTITGEDGARGPYGTKDLVRNAECTSGTLEDGAMHCFPLDYAVASPSYSTDATCSTPGVLVGPSACPLPAWTVTSAPNCSARLAVGQRGAEVSTYYTRSGTQCVAQTPPAQYRVFTSVPVPASAFPLATVARTGAWRLQMEQHAWPGGLTLTGGFYDTQLASPCSPWFTAADGQRRCLPAFLNAWDSFADASCTQRLVEGGPACPPAWAATWESATCGNSARVHLFPVLGQHSGTVYRKYGATCEVATPAAGTTYFRLGAERPAGDFVPLTETLR